jgi:hypothetical protein
MKAWPRIALNGLPDKVLAAGYRTVPPRSSFPRRRKSRIGDQVSPPVIPAQAGIQYPTPFLDSRLRGNDRYFDRIIKKKKRGWRMKAWPDTKLRSIGR